jgi:hypothetical protein
MTLRSHERLRLVAGVCALALLLVAAFPVAAGLPLAVLPDGPERLEPGSTRLPPQREASTRANPVVRSAVPARAPPLA